jgi:hypothetical protein
MMPSRKGRRSNIETHARRTEILAAIARHTPTKTISSLFGVSTYSIYRWIQANRAVNDRETRRAMRKLKGETLHRDDPELSSGDRLAVQLRDLEVQKRRMILVQDACLKIGDLRQAAFVADVIGRNCRHAASISEVLRLRQMSPAATFASSEEYKQLRDDLLQAPSPEAVEHTEVVLNRFEAKTAPYVPDELEQLY